jgi:acyl-CoA synthetase (AMP-forming)/AMP-acid ligase II
MGNQFTSIRNTISVVYSVVKIKRQSAYIIKNNITFLDMFDETVDLHPTKMIYFKERSISLVEFSHLTHKIARKIMEMGVQPGHVVPLLANNSPEYLMMWIALARIGASAGLINTNLKDDSLKHCLDVSFEVSKHEDTRFIVYDNEHATEIDSLRFNYKDKHTEFIVLEELVDQVKENPLLTVNRSYTENVKFSDPLYYIYTSGTTGMPKAAKIAHLRFLVAGYAFQQLYGLYPEDKMYVSLPLYHSNGGMVGTGSALTTGMDLVIREKFSASNYFKDCAKYNCTVGVYIGECCRYILQTPAVDTDSNHKMRLLIGNGMRPEVWKPFVERFKVRIGEFYGSTEGNANLFNTVGKIGAIGYLPSLLQKVYPVKFVKFDRETETLIRDQNGYCIECGYGEVGEAVGLIKDDDATRKFDGYTNKAASEKKIAHNVFRDGDKWFRSGDLLRLDSDGFVYFVDRVGDTFRWKGENVATTEVCLAITKEPQLPGVEDVNVYGVLVPNCQDGRIGMMSIRKQADVEIDFSKLYQKAQSLPKYAQPYFVRILPQADMTSTFKHKKVKLREEGFDINQITDPVYILNRATENYVLLTPEIYQDILDGKKRL